MEQKLPLRGSDLALRKAGPASSSLAKQGRSYKKRRAIQDSFGLVEEDYVLV